MIEKPNFRVVKLMFMNLISKKNRLILIIICTLLFYAFSTAAVAAGAGTGTGTGSGTKPFNFVGAYLTTCNENSSSTEAEVTAAPVPVKPTIKITFDKNVVYDAIWPNNEQCLNMFTSSGVKVPSQVFRISDQDNFEERHNIFITPVQDLSPSAEYKIVVSPDLLDKSGATLGMTTNNQPVVIQFTAQSPSESSAVSGPVSSSPTPGATQREKLSTGSMVLYIVAGTFLVLGCLWIGLRWLTNKK